jgi:hypothetical protein
MRHKPDLKKLSFPRGEEVTELPCRLSPIPAKSLGRSQGQRRRVADAQARHSESPFDAFVEQGSFEHVTILGHTMYR